MHIRPAEDNPCSSLSNIISIKDCGKISENCAQHFRRLCAHTVFLHERDYVTFGSLLSQIRLSVYMSSLCLSVMSVHPTQRVERLAIFLHLCVLGHPLTSVQNFTEVVPRNPLSGR